MGIKETDLYCPVKEFFENLGYRVNSEVARCDVTAFKDDELIVVELKIAFNLKLLYQVVNRTAITSQVYACIPRPRTTRSADYRNMLTVMRRLELGLMTVAMDSPSKAVEILLYPGERGGINKTKRGTVLKEIMSRSADANKGGSRGVKINTAYRERAIKIACILERLGPMSAAALTNEHGCDKDAYGILYKNPYGWFKRVSTGLYDLDEPGRAALNEKVFASIVELYRNN